MHGEHLTWSLPVISYLFLAGMGAGALATSASVLLRSGPTGTYFNIARYGAFIAPIPVSIGCFLLIFELGTFQVGLWFRWVNLYRVINLSPMSIGTWLLTFFVGISVLYAATFLPRNAAPGDKWDLPRRLLAWVCVPLGIGVAVYTGVLLGAMPSRPFWNSPILAMLFLLSSLSTGIAAIMLAWAILHRKGDPEAEHRYRESGYLLTASDILLIALELLVLLLFIMYAHLTIGSVKHAISVILAGGPLATTFWVWVVLIGLLIPAAIELFLILPRLLYQKTFEVHRSLEVFMPLAVLIGGFMLRYVVVTAGQLTYPVGL